MTELPSWALLAIMYTASAVAWPRAGQRIALHWNVHGQIDGYGGRFTGLLVLPLVATGLYLLFRCLPRINPGRTNYPSLARAYDVLRTAALAFMAALHLLILAPVFGHRVGMTSAIPALVGALLVVLGAVMGKVRPNWFFGIRTPWTLSQQDGLDPHASPRRLVVRGRWRAGAGHGRRGPARGAGRHSGRRAGRGAGRGDLLVRRLAQIADDGLLPPARRRPE